MQPCKKAGAVDVVSLSVVPTLTSFQRLTHPLPPLPPMIQHTWYWMWEMEMR